jgi:hypothetical protein
MTGLLIPPWYKDEVPGTTEMNIASVIFGFSLGSAVFTAFKAAGQTHIAYKRGRPGRRVAEPGNLDMTSKRKTTADGYAERAFA